MWDDYQLSRALARRLHDMMLEAVSIGQTSPCPAMVVALFTGWR
jgi:hypothetical protein